MLGNSALHLNAREEHPPLVMHVIYRLSVGGLENGLVNLINHMPAERYRHAIVCLTDHTEFRNRITRQEVPVIALHRATGRDLGTHRRFWRTLRCLRPHIVHTRNLPALEYLVPAALAGVPGRIHGEHGRDVYDLDGANFKYNMLRRAVRPLVHHYTAVSADLAAWLLRTVGIHRDRVTQILNGVDTRIFHPRSGPRVPLGPEGFAPPGSFVLGTVGRMQAVKDQVSLARAFAHLLETLPGGRDRLRLVMVGDGPLRDESLRFLRNASADQLAWLPGDQPNVADILRGLDLFVLPSLREGISNTILEAMASGLPVVATRVGGSPEVVEEGETGMLVPPGDAVALADAIGAYVRDHDLSARHGCAGRKRVEARFSLEAMVNGYMRVYESVLSDTQGRVFASDERSNSQPQLRPGTSQ